MSLRRIGKNSNRNLPADIKWPVPRGKNTDQYYVIEYLKLKITKFDLVILKLLNGMHTINVASRTNLYKEYSAYAFKMCLYYLSTIMIDDIQWILKIVYAICVLHVCIL